MESVQNSLQKTLPLETPAVQNSASNKINDIFIQNMALETSSGRPRSNSMNRAKSKIEKYNDHKHKLCLKSAFILDRSHYKLNRPIDYRLEEFQSLVKSSILSLLTAIEAYANPKLEIMVEPSTPAAVADKIIAALAGSIPFLGSLLKLGIEFVSPTQKIVGDYRKKQFQKLSQHLNSHEQIDLINEEFSSLVTAYYQADILSAKKNLTLIQEFKQLISDFVDKIIEPFKKPGLIERHITGVDDKIEKIDESYKEHWKPLLEKIIEQFLLNFGSVSFENVRNFEVALCLSQSLTPVSSEQLVFKSANETTLPQEDLMINAHSLSRIVLLAYETQNKIEEMALLWKYPEKKHFFFFKNDTQAFLLIDSKKMIISFRGTDTAANALEDAIFVKTAPWNNEKEIEVHWGFWKALQQVWPDIKKHISDFLTADKSTEMKREIWFTGHSLGGAMAVLAALDLSMEQASQDDQILYHVYTYGQPKCGNKAFADAINRRIPSYYRFVNYLDAIPRVPTQSLMGYHHAGQFYWLDSTGVKCHDEEAYHKALEVKDKYDKPQVRDNVVKLFQHINDHLMISYEQKIRNSLCESNRRLSYSEHLQQDFNIMLGENYSSSSIPNIPQKAEIPVERLSEKKETVSVEKIPAHVITTFYYQSSSTLSPLTENHKALLNQESAELLEVNETNLSRKWRRLDKKQKQLQDIKYFLTENQKKLNSEVKNNTNRTVNIRQEIEEMNSKIENVKLHREETAKSSIPFYGQYYIIKKIVKDPKRNQGEKIILSALLSIPLLNTVSFFYLPLGAHLQLKEYENDLLRLNAQLKNLEQGTPTLEQEITSANNLLLSVEDKITQVETILTKLEQNLHQQ